MRKSTVVLTASLVLLSACGPTRNPAYVCMHDCAHYCADGASGDECRRNIQLQQGANATDNGENYPDDRYYYPEGRSYYYGTAPGHVTYVTPVPDTSDTTTTTTITTKTYAPY